jgi:Multiubiquitin
VNTDEAALTKREVRIHINREPYESLDPTTGAALYALGKVGAHRELFREVDGNHEDAAVPRDETTLHLKQDEHFYSEKDFKIIVNGREKVVTTKVLSFKEIVALAFNPVPTRPNVLFTITYEHGPHANPEGTLMEGAAVKIKEGMIFNVRQTDKS